MSKRSRDESVKQKKAASSGRKDRYTICFIGNSHLIALEQALALSPPPLARGVATKLFMAPTPLLGFLGLEDGAIVARSPELESRLEKSSGETKIDIDRYDAFVLAGLRFSVNILGLCARTGTVEHRGSGDVQQLVSRAVFAKTIAASIERAEAVRVADMIRKRSQAPILLCPTPCRPEHALDDPEYKSVRRLHDVAYLESVVEEFFRAAERVAADRKCEVVWQPPETIAMPGFTKFEYSRSATEPDRPSIANDRWHANTEFGRLYLATILKRLDERSGGRVLSREAAAPA